METYIDILHLNIISRNTHFFHELSAVSIQHKTRPDHDTNIYDSVWYANVYKQWMSWNSLCRNIL